MTTRIIDRDEVVDRSRSLPSFPRVISEILDTLDDPDASLQLLTGHIQRDAVITARILAMANRASAHTRRQAAVRDVFTATSLIGLNRVREIALYSAASGYVARLAPDGRGAEFWLHSVAVGSAASELALHAREPMSLDSALVAGLLHDIGQLWLREFDRKAQAAAWQDAREHDIEISRAEREHFGVDHSAIGSWLGEHWGLNPAICAAIRCHHDPDGHTAEPLVAVTHVAEVFSHALDLNGREENRVTGISAQACSRLGLAFNDDIRPLFGRIEARSRYAAFFFG